MIRVSLIIVASLTLALAAFAAVNVIQSVADLPMQVTNRSIDANGISLELELAEPIWTTVETEEAPVGVAELMNRGFIEEQGFPLIPITGRMFRLPPQGGVTVEVIEAAYETLHGIEYEVYNNNTHPQALNRIEEPRDDWYPEEIAFVEAPGIFHDFRVSKLMISPIQVNTARREVRVYSNIQVRLNFTGEDNRAALDASPTKISETYLTHNTCHYWQYEMLNLGYTEIDTNYIYDRNVNPTIISLNEGATFYNFSGGISDGLNQNEINGLTNFNKLYFACEITDNTGNWVGGTSLCEYHVRLVNSL